MICTSCRLPLAPRDVIINDICMTIALRMDPLERLESVRAWIEGIHLPCKRAVLSSIQYVDSE